MHVEDYIGLTDLQGIIKFMSFSAKLWVYQDEVETRAPLENKTIKGSMYCEM